MVLVNLRSWQEVCNLAVIPVVSTVIKVSKLVISEELEETVTVTAFLYAQFSSNQAASADLRQGPNINNKDATDRVRDRVRVMAITFCK